ncbi:unnamed protein product, partial [marine sediment metagenome]
MNLKQIVRKGLIVGGLIAALSGFADANLPKVNANELLFFQMGREYGIDCISLGYDTDGDNLEDLKFHYKLYSISKFGANTDLGSYAVDLNKDGKL